MPPTTPEAGPGIEQPIAYRKGLTSVIRSRLSLMLFCLFVLIPTSTYAVYLLGFASPRYTSEFRALVRSPATSREIGLPQMIGLSLPGQSNENSYAVIQYLESEQAAADLNRSINLRGLFSHQWIDRISRLPSDASRHAFTKYWRGKLDAYYENTTGTIVVRVNAFTPSQAHLIAQSALTLSENLVNGMSRRSRRDMVEYSEQDVAAAAAELRQSQAKMLALRNRRGLIDPRGTATANLSRQTRIETEITTVRAELSTKAAYLDRSSPIMQILSQRLRALEKELGSVSAESTRAHDSNGTLSESISDFEGIEADQNFIARRYQAALAGLQQARAESARQQLYLDTVVGPTLPDDPAYPRPFVNISVFLLFAFGVWFIVIAIVSAAREHA